MPTKLDTFLFQLTPEKTIDKTQAAADRALNSFSVPSSSYQTWDDFKQMMAEFFCLVDSKIIGLKYNRSTNISMDWSRCSELLTQKYGSQGGQAAFSIAKTGVEGGLYAILKYIAEALARQFSTNWIQCKIGEFWNSLSHEERLAVPTEYLGKYQHLLPQEILEQSTSLFAANFFRFLEHHPQMIKRLRNIR